jgi:hypothetical protein
MVLPRLALAVTLLLISSAALAHGDADWIRQGADYGWCCGPQDCERAPVGAILLEDGIYVVPSTRQSFAFRGRPEDRIFPSIDADYWWCLYPDGRIRCLFVPPLTW